MNVMVSKFWDWVFEREPKEQWITLVDKLLIYTGANTEHDNFFFITICFRCFWITLGEPDRYKTFCEKCEKNDQIIVRGVHGKYDN